MLMIAAQLLLTVFTIHWLWMQYNERWALLTKDVSEAWTDSRQQMIDSMLLKQYIEPALDSNARYNFHFVFNTDSMHSMVQDEKMQSSTTRVQTLAVPAGKSRIIVNISDSVNPENEPGKKPEHFFTRDLVLQGVKLFVNTQTDSAGRKTDLSAAWLEKPDTNLLKSNFSARLNSIDPSIRISWSIDSTSDSADKHRIMRYYILAGESKLEADVSGYRLFLLHEIMPQIAFALLLVLLTGLAFILSFRSLKAQIALNSQRNDFIRNMSHELKTPVATVKVALEALKRFNRSSDPEVMDEYLTMAMAETSRLELLISRVMNIAGGNGDLIRPNLEPTDLKKLIMEVIAAFSPRIESENAIVSFNFPDNAVMINVDRLHIQGVIINLIDNGLKYSKPPANITISITTDVNSVVLAIADKGIGIPEEYRSRIFEKFFRVPTGDLHNTKGYGLGLSYALMVMKQHNGNISCKENQGGGSIFELTFTEGL